MTLFQGKYRIESNRLQGWNYGSNALYFVTICTKNREYYFGDVLNGEMQLSEIGLIANKYWLEIPEHFPFVKIHEHVIMPNHVHGIIEICKTDKHNVDDNDDVDAQNIAHQRHYKNKFGPQSNNLASIVRGYKTGVTVYARKNNLNFNWQPNYHDAIIRNDKSYSTIANYIMNNPKKWQEDRFYGEDSER
jgi:REP element-mobilizing transposase RayT